MHLTRRGAAAPRRELRRLKLTVAPTAEVCRRLEHLDLPGIDPSFRPYYRDVVDHLNRALEQVEALREMLAFAFEAGLLTEQARQGVVSRRLAGWAAILAVPTAIAGPYGMNLEHMPGLTAPTRSTQRTTSSPQPDIPDVVAHDSQPTTGEHRGYISPGFVVTRHRRFAAGDEVP